MAKPAQTARSVAISLLEGVYSYELPLSELLADPAFAGGGLEPSERARAQRLALAVLRQGSRADQALKPFMRREPPPFVRAVLRLGTIEMLDQGAAAHGVVNEAVALVRQSGLRGESFAGLVNAVLRKVAETDPAQWAAFPPQPLANWLRGRLMSAYGKQSTMAMEAVQALAPPLDLTPKNGDAAALATTLSGVALPTGSVRLTNPGQITGLAGFDTGDWWVQDAAAALAAKALAAKPGERVLDLCAAPGGKTMQLAATGADVTALDISGPRMARVGENLARCGLSATLITDDALHWQPDTPFDAVLLDAPCSATGTIRRHPDLPFVKQSSALKDLMALQAALIDRAAAMVRPGGRLVICTCSLLPEEGELMGKAALERHPELELDREALALPGVEPEWVSAEGGLRLRPDYWREAGGMDGFYILALRRAL